MYCSVYAGLGSKVLSACCRFLVKILYSPLVKTVYRLEARFLEWSLAASGVQS